MNLAPALASLIALLPFQEQPDQSSGLRFVDRPEGVHVEHGPVILHADIDMQWGGSVFDYLLEGERGVFWSAKADRAGPVIIGQYPVPGSDLSPLVTEIDLAPRAAESVTQPHILRTPDGYLHLICGFALAEAGPDPVQHGYLRYYRSARPEDVSEFVDRTELLPVETYPTLHENRRAVGISRDGSRMVLIVLSDFQRGRYLMNTPLVFYGERDGLDFEFGDPIAWGPADTPFFYPLVAVTEHGVVAVGAVDDDPSRSPELVHLNWQGEVLLWEKLPRPDYVVRSYACALQPLEQDDWSRLLIATTVRPVERQHPRQIEFWEYDAARRRLELRRSFEHGADSEVGYSNAGKFLMVPGKPPLFVNEPGSKEIAVWEGDLTGQGPLRIGPLPGTDPGGFGYTRIRSIFLPSVLTGSVPVGSSRAVAVDVEGPRMQDGDTNPCSFLMWRIRLEQ